jgi:hypothetical protein
LTENVRRRIVFDRTTLFLVDESPGIGGVGGWMKGYF